MLLDLLPQLLFLLCFTPVALLWGGQCCQFKLVSCDDPEDIIYTQSSGLSSNVGKVVTLSTPDDPTCRTVERICSLPEGEEWTAVVVDEVFDDCEACAPCTCFKLENCVIPGQIIYTETDLSDYLGGSVVLDEYPTVCWAVTCGDETCTDPEPVTVVESFPTCDDCIDDEVPDEGNPIVDCNCTPNSKASNFLIRFGTLSGCCSPQSNTGWVISYTGSGCVYNGGSSSVTGCSPALGIQMNIDTGVIVFFSVSVSCVVMWAHAGFPGVGSIFPAPHSCKHVLQNYQVPFYQDNLSQCSCTSSDPVTIWAV